MSTILAYPITTVSLSLPFGYTSGTSWTRHIYTTLNASNASNTDMWAPQCWVKLLLPNSNALNPQSQSNL